jgi:hypothetical protein
MSTSYVHIQYQLLSVNPGILLFEDLVWNK